MGASSDLGLHSFQLEVARELRVCLPHALLKEFLKNLFRELIDLDSNCANL